MGLKCKSVVVVKAKRFKMLQYCFHVIIDNATFWLCERQTYDALLDYVIKVIKIFINNRQSEHLLYFNTYHDKSLITSFKLSLNSKGLILAQYII